MKRSFYKMLSSYILVFLIPLVTMGLLSYWWIGNTVRVQVEQSYEAAVKEAKNSVDRRFQELAGFAVQLSYMPWIQKLMYMQGPVLDSNRVRVPDLTNYVMEMRGYDAINDFIDIVSIVLPEKQLVISSAGTANAELFFNELYKLEKTDYLRLQDVTSVYHTPAVLLPDLLHIKYSQPARVLTYIQPVPSADQKAHAVLVTYIKEDRLISLLEGEKISKSSTVYVLDSGGDIIVTVNEQNKQLLGTLKSQYSKDGKYKSIISYDGEKFFIFHTASSFNKWEYIITIPYKLVMAKVDNIKSTTIILTIVLSLAGFIFSYFFTTYNYNPLSKLVELIKSGVSYKSPSNESLYDFLSEAVNNLLAEDSQLRKEALQQKPLIRNAYFLKLLGGDDEFEGLEQILKLIDVNFPFTHYTAALFVLNTTKGISSEIQSKALYMMEVHRASTYFVELSGKKKAVVINIDNLESVNGVVDELKMLIEDELMVKCIAGVGKPCSSLKGLADSYKSALAAVDYRMVHDKTDIIYFGNISPVNTVYYYYPIDKETQLLNLLRIGKYDGAAMILKEIVLKNSWSSFNLNSAKCLSYDLLGTALKALDDLRLNDLVIIDQNYISSLDTMDEMENYMLELYKKICELIGDRKKSHNEILKESIRAYVDEYFDKQDFSLETTASAMGISIGYLSKFFKEEFDCNFLDYVNRKRIKKAKELLNGQMTVTQIARIVGYGNDVTFRRVFKKYEGLTPGVYIVGG